MQQWIALAVASDQSHLLMNYGVQSSSGLMYNLFADKLLNLSLVNPAVSFSSVLPTHCNNSTWTWSGLSGPAELLRYRRSYEIFLLTLWFRIKFGT